MPKPAYSQTAIGTHLLVVDTETSGSSWETYEETFRRYQVLSIALILATSDTFKPVKELYIELKFDAGKYEWTTQAEAIHGLTREHLEENGLSNEDAAAEVAQFIFDHFGTGKVMILGHNPGFDIAALEQLLEPHGVMPTLHHVVLDTSALGVFTIGEFRSKPLFEFFHGSRAEKHNALDDARMTLEVAATVRGVMNEVLNQ